MHGKPFAAYYISQMVNNCLVFTGFRLSSKKQKFRWVSALRYSQEYSVYSRMYSKHIANLASAVIGAMSSLFFDFQIESRNHIANKRQIVREVDDEGISKRYKIVRQSKQKVQRLLSSSFDKMRISNVCQYLVIDMEPYFY